MHWFTETPWPPVLICAAVAMLLLVRQYMGGRGIYLIGVLVTVLAGCAIVVVEHYIVTERERIEIAIHDLADSVKQKDLNKTLSYFSVRNTGDRADVQKYLSQVVEIGYLRITDMQIETRSSDTRATSHFRANADVVIAPQYNLGRVTTRWRLDWQLEGGEWKIVETARFEPFGDDQLPIGGAQ